MAARPRQVSNEEILQVACECFLAHGPGVSTQVIADQLGISQPALFKRFNTKEELMLSALLPPQNLPAIEWVGQGPQPGPFQPQLEALVRVLWQTLQIVFPRISMLLMSGVPHESIHCRFEKLPLIVLMNAVAEWFGRARQLGQIRKEGDLMIWTQVCMGALQGRAALRFILAPHFERHADERYKSYENDEVFIKSVADLLWRGMAES